jgi:hypothetical protein
MLLCCCASNLIISHVVGENSLINTEKFVYMWGLVAIGDTASVLKSRGRLHCNLCKLWLVV